MLNLCRDFRSIKSGDRYFEVIELCGQCGFIFFLSKQNDCRLTIENAVPGFFKKGCVFRHVIRIYRAADQHAHTAAQQYAKRAAEDTDQTADQAAFPCVITGCAAVDKTVHDIERAIFFLHDSRLREGVIGIACIALQL